MPKTKVICTRLSANELAIVEKYQHDHPGCKPSQAIKRMIEAYPLLLAKSETRQIGQRLKETITSKKAREPIMPDLCKHIVELDMPIGRVLCDLKNLYVSADQCSKCERRQPIDA